MSKEIDYQTYIGALAHVKRSKNRVKVVKTIGTTVKIPSEIAETMGLRINQISAVLGDLKKHNIVICLNEHEKTGRLHQLTPLGLRILEFLKKMEQEE